MIVRSEYVLTFDYSAKYFDFFIIRFVDAETMTGRYNEDSQFVFASKYRMTIF